MRGPAAAAMFLSEFIATAVAVVSGLASGGAADGTLAERCSDGSTGGACVCLASEVRSAPMPEPAALTLAGLALLAAGSAALRRRQ